MANFQFDDTKTFEENSEAFLVALEHIDAKMTGILRDNWDTLVSLIHEGQRDLRARGEFNATIASALDALALPDASDGGA